MSLVMFDVDGPLVVDRTPDFFQWVNAQPDTVTPWSYQVFSETGDWVTAAGGLENDDISRIYLRYVSSGDSHDMQITPGARQAFSRMGNLTKYITTARNPSLREMTEDFLRRHLGSFAGHYYQVHWEKASLASELNAAFIIDDNPQILRLIASETETRPILFPSRHQRQLSDMDGIEVLAAEAQVENDMTDKSFARICQQAWLEIVTILQNSTQACLR